MALPKDSLRGLPCSISIEVLKALDGLPEIVFERRRDFCPALLLDAVDLVSDFTLLGVLVADLGEFVGFGDEGDIRGESEDLVSID